MNKEVSGKKGRSWIDHFVLGVIYATLCACASSPAIELASTSKSHFADAVYKGEGTIVAMPPAGIDEYRLFEQAATGFVSIGSVRSDVETRAADFCARSDKHMQEYRETVAKPPYILGNFPRMELVFGCTVKTGAANAGDDSQYVRLTNLKKLLDSGVLTPEEFDNQKSKILAEQ